MKEWLTNLPKVKRNKQKEGKNKIEALNKNWRVKNKIKRESDLAQWWIALKQETH